MVSLCPDSLSQMPGAFILSESGTPNNIKSLKIFPNNGKLSKLKFQLEWEEWFRWKKSTLKKVSRKTPLAKYAQWFLALLLGGSPYFFFWIVGTFWIHYLKIPLQDRN
ncbi:MAG: hypothetical protein Ct9H300mP21_00010 [Pseudomonadota bacterium]|nr:MAG: hypothetical protein Ct9H300mP21_00010 [Pseudomonadota bacterium]